MKLKANKKAPNFKLPSTGKSIFELKKIKKNIILYFYPKDDTPGCTIEARDFSKLNSLIYKNKAGFMAHILHFNTKRENYQYDLSPVNCYISLFFVDHQFHSSVF